MQRLLLFIWWKKEISGGEGVHWTDDEIVFFFIIFEHFFQTGGVYL
jgi:hypothetical protein